MKNLTIVIMFLLVCPTLLLAEGNVKQEYKNMKVHDMQKVKLVVDIGDRGLKNLIESYLRRELRALGDVIIDANNFEWALNVVAIKIPLGDEEFRIAYSMHLYQPASIPLFNSISSSLDEQKKSVFQLLSLQKDHIIYTGRNSIDRIKAICAQIVADSDHHFNDSREIQGH